MKSIILYSKNPGANYRFNLENNDTKIHIIAEYTSIDAEVTLLSQLIEYFFYHSTFHSENYEDSH